jgi:hypothetical protein
MTPWWYDVEDPNGWDIPPWVEDPDCDKLFRRKLKPVASRADTEYSELHAPDEKDTTVSYDPQAWTDGPTCEECGEEIPYHPAAGLATHQCPPDSTPTEEDTTS